MQLFSSNISEQTRMKRALKLLPYAPRSEHIIAAFSNLYFGAAIEISITDSNRPPISQ